MAGVTAVSALKELHRDLGRKYKRHEVTIDTLWRSFDAAQRSRCLKAGAADGVVLQHPLDKSMGNVYKFIPECNLRDIAQSGPDFLLNLLRHRATTSLFEQYCKGAEGGPGDHGFIIEMEETRGLRHIQPFDNSFTLFLDENQYGESFQRSMVPLRGYSALLHQLSATGELIMQRQLYLTQCLVILIDDILEEGSQTRAQKELPKKLDRGASAAFASLTIQDPPAQVSWPELVASTREQKAILDDSLSLLCAEPVALAHAVNFWFFSRPELLADEKGCRLPAHTDQYISGAILDAVRSAVQGAAIWDYICRLLELLEAQDADKVYRPIILQEIANVSHLGYDRARALFRRCVQTGTGAKYFRRQPGAFDEIGNAAVSMKCNLGKLAKSDPQLHSVMRLCQPEASAQQSAEWLKKLAELNESDPTAQDRLLEGETDALSDLVVAVGFIRDISAAIPMPQVSRKRGQMFVSRSHDLETELHELKNQVDLLDFASPIDNLLEPGMAEGALQKLDQFVIDKVGTKMGFLYEDLVQDCLALLKSQYEQAKARVEQAKAKEEQENRMDWIPIPVPPPQPREKRVEERRQKEKTRPAHSSVYDITPAAAEPAAEPEEAAPSHTLKVRPSTAEVFSTLFDKKQSRGSVNWVDFEAAMADLGFSFMPKFGSVYTFLPPKSMGTKSVTVHRPHKSRIEGYSLLIVSRRLKRVYGWGDKTFTVS